MREAAALVGATLRAIERRVQRDGLEVWSDPVGESVRVYTTRAALREAGLREETSAKSNGRLPTSSAYPALVQVIEDQALEIARLRVQVASLEAR